MKVKGKKKEMIVSISFLVFFLAVVMSSFYFNQGNSSMQAVSGNAVAGLDGFTNKLTLVGSLIGLVIVVITVVMIVNYLSRLKKIKTDKKQ